MKIGIIGTGYVGLVTGCCLAETGNQVLCMDINEQKIKNMKDGQVPIYEPGLERIFRKNIAQNRLKFTAFLEEVVVHSAILFLALPTPQGADGFADLQYVLGIAEKLGSLIKEYKIIVDKSTVPVGTSEKIKNVIQKDCKVVFDVVSNPEFLREGYAVEDFMRPDRIVIGTRSEQARTLLAQLYAPYVRQGNPILFMDERSAELSKYASNAFLATKISFMNEISVLCEKLGADIDKVRNVMGEDERIGRRFLFAGLGYGGSCFPKDVNALFKTSEENNYNFQILKSVISVNENQKKYFLNKILTYFNEDVKGKTIALWGLSFKPNTDDIREAPSLFILDNLLARGAKIMAYDPEAMPHIAEMYKDRITLQKDMYSVLETSDALVIVTEWPEFRAPNWESIEAKLLSKVIFDGRNIFDAKILREKGYHYESIGRGHL